MAPRPIRHSGLQKQVLSLYRECLRKVIQLSKANNNATTTTTTISNSTSVQHNQEQNKNSISTPGTPSTGSTSSTIPPSFTTTSSSSSSSSSSTTSSSIIWQNNDGIQFIRQEFRNKSQSIDKLDIQRIEFLIRQGKKRLELLNMPGINNLKSIQRL